jgi:hypothetical protein
MIELTRKDKELIWHFLQHEKVHWLDFLASKCPEGRIDYGAVTKRSWIKAGQELYAKGFIRPITGSTWEYELHPRTIEHWAIINRIRKKYAPKKS